MVFYKQKMCQHCGNLFTPPHGRSVYCSIECKKNHFNLMRRTRYRDTIKKMNDVYREKNREQDRLYKLSYYYRHKVNNAAYYLIKSAKARAKKKAIPFDLKESDLIFPDICPIMGVPFDPSDKRYNYSIDRIDSTKGYTKDNIWIISYLANAMKWDSSSEELIRFAKGILSLEGG